MTWQGHHKVLKALIPNRSKLWPLFHVSRVQDQNTGCALLELSMMTATQGNPAFCLQYLLAITAKVSPQFCHLQQ